MQKYEEVRVPTTHLKPTNWERFCWKWEKLTFYIYLVWSRYLWFLTSRNLIGIVVAVFIAGVISLALRSDILPKSELIRYERTMDSMHIMDSRLENFERERMMWELQFNEKLRQLEDTMYKSLSEIRSETQKLHVEIEQYKGDQEGDVRDVPETFKNYLSSRLEKLETEIGNRVTDIESRVAAANEQILTFTNSCFTTYTKSACLKSNAGVTTRRYAVNLASRSHGAFVVPHLTSRAVTSGSLLHTVVDAVFGLQTYNFAITERSHIMPSEAFCFIGSEGNLTIRLWENATIEAIEYEHDYWRNYVPISAPKQYDVIACQDRECEKSVMLAECTYPSNEKDGPAQICQMQNLSISTDQVRLAFKMNHGQEYTCIYQLRVLSWR